MLLLSFITNIFSIAQAAYVCITALSETRCLINCGKVPTTISLGKMERNVITYFIASAFKTGNSFTKNKAYCRIKL